MLAVIDQTDIVNSDILCPVCLSQCVDVCRLNDLFYPCTYGNKGYASGLTPSLSPSVGKQRKADST